MAVLPGVARRLVFFPCLTLGTLASGFRMSTWRRPRAAARAAPRAPGQRGVIRHGVHRGSGRLRPWLGCITDIEEFFKHADVRMEYFCAFPTSTTVEVRRLVHPDLLVEVEVIAVVG